MKRTNYKVYLQDILDAMEKIERYVDNMSFEEFVEDNKTVDAVIRNMEIIGEAARKIPEDVKNKYPNIAWKEMIGLRNIIAHEYSGIDITIVWQIVKKNIPESKPQIKKVFEDT